MRSLIVYESMYGNTRQVAEAIAEGCRRAGSATVVRVPDFEPNSLTGIDLLVLGGPTHVWSMSRPNTRQTAISKPGQGTPPSEAHLGEPGIRELVEELPRPECPVAVYDTRIAAPPLVTGRASAAIARRLRRKGVRPLGSPRSFLVNRTSRLRPGELERARLWGIELTEQHARLADSRSR